MRKGLTFTRSEGIDEVFFYQILDGETLCVTIGGDVDKKLGHPEKILVVAEAKS